MEIDLSKTAIENCPHFSKCQVNKCPLHPDYRKLKDYDCDKKLYNWHKCRAEKPTRKKIGKAFGLKKMGLTGAEWGGLQVWAKLSPKEKEARKRKLMKLSPILKLYNKGYGISRVENYKAKFTLSNELKTAQEGKEEEDDM